MHCCCDEENSASQGTDSSRIVTSPHSWSHRAAALAQWSLPIATLALIPKCPVCVAAYVLLFTGVGLSISAASVLRWSLIIMSLLTLAFLVLRLATRAAKSHDSRQPSAS